MRKEMERRREPRFPCNQPARITCLSGQEQSFDGLLVNLSGRGLRIALTTPIPVNIPIRIDVGDMLLLGDICYCRKEDDVYSVGVALAHSILEMSALTHLMTRLTHDSHYAQEAVERVKLDADS